MSEQEEFCRLEYHNAIVNLQHRENCNVCKSAFIAMSMIIDLSTEEKNE